MTASYIVRPFTVPPEAAPKPRGPAAEGQPWGTPTGEELAALLDSLRASLEEPTIPRREAIALLSESHAMLLRCQAALPMSAGPQSSQRQEAAA
jgi:hypothetical protein